MKPSPTLQREPLTVALRVRPMNTAETKAGAKQIAFAVDEKLVVLMDPNDDSDDILRANRSREKKYVFDQAFDQHATQQDIYDSTVKAKNVVDKILNGFNCTVFAYGATGTGKTHTMLGTVEEPGIMILTLNDLYKKIDETKPEKLYKVSMAYIEIYNEMVRDLLKENPSEQVLDLREDSKGEVIISGLLDLEARSTSDIMNLLSQGNQRRTSEPTAANKTSSRSHALMKLSIEQRSRAMNVKQEVKNGVLFMVDLAGSERAAVTQNRGMRMIEGAHINRSLLALANCINSLTSHHHHHHFVNYRDSKLTRLLKEALGGNCMTMMIAHISPASTVFEESRNTLVYAERGKKIKNKARQNIVDVNYHVTQYQHIIDTLNARVQHLQCDLEKQHASYPQDLEATRLCEQLKNYSQEEKEIKQEILTLEYHLLQNAVECQKHLTAIKKWEQQRISLSSLPSPLSSLELLSPQSVVPGCNHQETKPLQPQVYNIQAKESSVEEEQFSDAYLETSDSLSKSSSSCEHTESLFSRVASKTEDIPKDIPKKTTSQIFQPTFRLPVDAQMTTLDSCTCAEVPTDMEPLWVSGARGEVAILEADMQQMEAHHSQLQERLKENTTKMATVKQKISVFPGLHPTRKELIDLLCQSCEKETTAVEHSVAATLMSVQLGQHETLIDRLLAHSSSLTKMVTSLHSSLKEMGVGIPAQVSSQSKELVDRQRELNAQVLAEKQIPLLSKKMEIPHLAQLSAKLYTTRTGSKPNLLIESEGKEDSDPPLSLSTLPVLSTQPSIQSPLNWGSFPSLSTTTLATVSQVIPAFLQLSSSSSVPMKREQLLSPINPSLTSNPVVTQEVAQEMKGSVDVIEPLADSSLARILRAAKEKAKKASSKSTLINTRKRITSSKKVLGGVTSLTSKRITHSVSTKSKYTVPKSMSCVDTGNPVEKNISDSSSMKRVASQKSMPRKLPMDRLVTVMKSRRKPEVPVLNETRFKMPKPSKQKLKPIDNKPSLPLMGVTKAKNLMSVGSLSLLQSSKKLGSVSKAKIDVAKRREFPVTTKVFTSSLTDSPYQSPLRAVFPKLQGSPKRNQFDKGHHGHLKHSHAWK